MLPFGGFFLKIMNHNSFEENSFVVSQHWVNCHFYLLEFRLDINNKDLVLKKQLLVEEIRKNHNFLCCLIL